MKKILFNRLIFYLATTPLLILLILIATKISPTDPVEEMMKLGDFIPDQTEYDKLYKQVAQKHGLDLPIFYLSFTANNAPKQTLNRREKALYYHFSKQGAAPHLLNDLISSLKTIMQNETYDAQKKTALLNLYYPNRQKVFSQCIQELQTVQPEIHRQIEDIKASFSYWNKWPPVLCWHGTNNQLHHYFNQAFKGNLGNSFGDNTAVLKQIWKASQYTILLTILINLLSFPIGFRVGRWLTHHKDKIWTPWVSSLFFGITILPFFWLATMMLITLAKGGPSWFSLFDIPAQYTFDDSQSPIQNMLHASHQLILPILCLLFYYIPSIALHTKALLDGELDKPYMLTVKMKGLSKKIQIQQHAFKNIRVQIITLISILISNLLKGSLIIEYIFNIPGLGFLTYQAAKRHDIPILLGITWILFTCFIIVNTITDILYTRVNQQISVS